jgi:hypothetical protein
MIDLASIIIAITSLVIIWAIVSIPVWISAKIFFSRHEHIKDNKAAGTEPQGLKKQDAPPIK